MKPSPGRDRSTTSVKGHGDPNPRQLTDVNGTLFFTANDGTNGPSSGRATGPPRAPSRQGHLPRPHGLLRELAHRRERARCSSRPTTGRTGSSSGRATAPRPGPSWSRTSTPGRRGRAAMADQRERHALLHGQRRTTGRELWKSDGTAAGTVLVKDIDPGRRARSRRPSRTSDGTLFFTADDGSTGNELWKSDGTPAGTTLVKDISVAAPRPGLTAVGDPVLLGAASDQRARVVEERRNR